MSETSEKITTAAPLADLIDARLSRRSALKGLFAAGVATVAAADLQRVEVRGLQYDGGRVVGELGGLAAHDAGDADRAGVVGDQQVVRPGSQAFAGFGEAACRIHAVAFTQQRQFVQRAQIGFIVHHQDVRCRGG